MYRGTGAGDVIVSHKSLSQQYQKWTLVLLRWSHHN